MFKNIIYLLILNLLLNGCAWFGSQPSTSGTRRKTTTIPHTKLTQIPYGNGDNWRYLGITPNNSLIDEINSASIKNINSINTPTTISYQDRKTVTLPNKFIYSPNQPHFKYVLSNWQINCITKEYLLSDTTLFDNLGNQISHYHYINNVNVAWLKIEPNSFSQLQFNFICLRINNNLGY